MIRNAIPKDYGTIQYWSKKLDLDTEKLYTKEFIVFTVNGRIAGFGRLKPYKDYCCEISDVGVLPKFRHKGIGAKIVKELIKMEKNNAFLITTIPKFFKKLGFNETTKLPKSVEKKLKKWKKTEKVVGMVKKIKSKGGM